MELTEPVESINNQLIDLFGIDTVTGQPMWRVVWSENQFEYRFGTYDDFTKSGLWLRTVTEVRYVPKYRQWIQRKYVLERLVVVPDVNGKDLPGLKLSYEPLYVFQTDKGECLPPKLEACKFAIDCVYAAQGKSSLAKYKDPAAGKSNEEILEMQNQKIDQLQKELFGNETDTGDAIAHGEAIIVPRNYHRES